METQRSIKLVMGGGPKAAKLGQPKNTVAKNAETDSSMRLGDLVEADRDNKSSTKDATADVATDDGTGNDATTIPPSNRKQEMDRALQKLNEFDQQIKQGIATAQQARAANEAAKAAQQAGGYAPKPPSIGGGGSKGSSGSGSKKSSGGGNSDTAKMKKALADAKKENEKNKKELAKLKKEKSSDSKGTEGSGSKESRTGDKDPNRRIDGLSDEAIEEYADNVEKLGYNLSPENKARLEGYVKEDARFEPILERVNAQERRDGKRDTEGIDADDALRPDEVEDPNSFDIDNPDAIDENEEAENEEVEEPEPEIEIDDSDEE